MSAVLDLSDTNFADFAEATRAGAEDNRGLLLATTDYERARRGAALVRSRRRVRRHALTKSQIASSAQCFVLIPRVPLRARRSWIGR